jgi:hypothetical protein
MTIEIPIVTTYKDKGAKAAQGGLDKLAGSAKKLGLALGLALSVNKIVAFGKSSVAEFTASEKAAASLQNTLRNTGNLLAFPDAEAGIKNLAKLSGIADDSLMPLFSQLYLATGNISTAMKDLNLAIDVSRGSTNELSTVVDALSKGYAGNTKSLGNLNLGLNKAYLATGDMVGIQKELNKTFGGASAAYLDTYAGKVAVLNNQWNETKEIVGQGLVIAFETATGNRGIGGMTKAMEDFGYTLDAIIIKFAQLTAAAPNLADRLGLGFITATLKTSINGWNYVLGIDETRLKIQNEIWKANTKTYEMAAKSAAEQAARNKDYLAFLAKQKKLADATKKAEADKAKLKKAGTLLDLDQIQIIAALQGKITDEEKLRLQLQMALLQENGTEADRLSNKLAASQFKTTDLARAIGNLPPALNPLKDYPTWVQGALDDIAKIQDALNKLKAPKLVIDISTSGGYTSAAGSAQIPSAPSAGSTGGLAGLGLGGDQGAVARALEQASMASVSNSQLSGYQDYRAGERNTNVNVTVQGNVISNKDLADTIRMQLLDSSASGSFTMSNRATRGD